MVSVASSLQQRQLCRYCRAPATPSQPLITPCKCRGSLSLVHRACLELCFRNRSEDDRLCHGCRGEIFIRQLSLSSSSRKRRSTADEAERASTLFDGDTLAADAARHTLAFVAVLLAVVTVFLLAVPVGLLLGVLGDDEAAGAEDEQRLERRWLLLAACGLALFVCLGAWILLLRRFLRLGQRGLAGAVGRRAPHLLDRHVCVKDLTKLADDAQIKADDQKEEALGKFVLAGSVPSTPRASF